MPASDSRALSIDEPPQLFGNCAAYSVDDQRRVQELGAAIVGSSTASHVRLLSVCGGSDRSELARYRSGRYCL